MERGGKFSEITENDYASYYADKFFASYVCHYSAQTYYSAHYSAQTYFRVMAIFQNIQDKFCFGELYNLSITILKLKSWLV